MSTHVRKDGHREILDPCVPRCPGVGEVLATSCRELKAELPPELRCPEVKADRWDFAKKKDQGSTRISKNQHESV